MYPKYHGSPYDRGRADSYYRRGLSPHKWLDAKGLQRVDLTDPAELSAYSAGYNDNEADGDYKEYQ
jgi:hypothetical protein